jgi:hypothetical protein
MQLSRQRARSFLPQRLRTIMIANLGVAMLMGILMPMRGAFATNASLIANTILLLLSVSIIGAVLTVPMILVQMYLYPKNLGLWYSWQHGPRRREYAGGDAPAHVRYPRSAEAASLRAEWKRVLSEKKTRTRLFEGAPVAGSVSRAALLMTVAARLEESGKREAARTCYRQIIDRFGAAPEAPEAARRIESIAREEHTCQPGIGCFG